MRMRRCLVLLLLTLVAVPSAVPAAAQVEDDGDRLSVAPIDTSGYPEIRTVLTAPSVLGGIRLGVGDITVTEDGEPRRVRVTRLPAEKLEVVLLVDTSGSMLATMGAARVAAAEFLRGLPAGVSVAVLGFGTEVTVVSPFTTETEVSIAAVESFEAAGETALYDAIDGALNQFEEASDARQAIVLLSDGGDTASERDLEAVRKRLGIADTTLYAMELRTSESDPAALQTLAEAADGLVAAADSTDELHDVYDRISSMLVNQYAVTFEATGHGMAAIAYTVGRTDARTTVEQSVRLPPPATSSEAEAPLLQIAAMDTSQHPRIELRVVSSQEFSDAELDAGGFTVLENGRERASSASRVKAQDMDDGAYDAVAADLVNQYLVQYESAASGPTEVELRVITDGVTARASRAFDLPTTSDAVGILGSRTALLVGAALWFVAVTLIILILLAPRERTGQLRGASHGAANAGRASLSALGGHASQIAQRTLQRRGHERGLNAALEKAGLNLRPGEFVVLAACASVAFAAFGLTWRGPLMGVVLGVAAVLLSKLVLARKAAQRQKAFADQLGETLQLLAGSLRAGYSLMQAVDAVAREADQPSADEFRRLVVETRLGRDLSEAMHAMDARLGSEDFAWVLQAIQINREVGGDLADVLDTVAGTIRERNQVRRQVQALSAEGKLSAIVLLMLPIGVGLFMRFSNPDYVAEFTNNGIVGWGLLGVAGLMMMAGALWLSKLIKIEF